MNRHFLSPLLRRTPGFRYLASLLDRIVSWLSWLSRAVVELQGRTAHLQGGLDTLQARTATLEQHLLKTVHLLEYRADQIYRNVVDGMRNGDGKSIRFPSVVDSAAAVSLRNTLFDEAAACMRPVVAEPVDPALFNEPRDGQDREYLAVHRRRYLATFDLIAGLASRHGPFTTVADLATFYLFHPGLRRTLPDARFIFVASEAPRPASLPAGDEWITGHNVEAQDLPIADGSVDLVLALEVIEHLLFDPMYMLAEANRILRPGGIVLLSTPNLASWRAATAVLTGYSPITYSTYSSRRRAGDSHVHEFVPRELRVLLEAAGFEPFVTTQNLSTVAVPKTIGRILEATAESENLLGDAIFAVGRKIGPVVDRKPKEFYGG
jgi:SAM-dependent methyltransferase